MKRGFLLKAEAKKSAAKKREHKSSAKDSDEQIKPFKAEESTHCKLLYCCDINRRSLSGIITTSDGRQQFKFEKLGYGDLSEQEKGLALCIWYSLQYLKGYLFFFSLAC